jgi:flagellar L-ring protein precursor FlgH
MPTNHRRLLLRPAVVAMAILSSAPADAQVISRQTRQQAQNEALQNLRTRTSVREAALTPTTWPGPQASAPETQQAAYLQTADAKTSSSFGRQTNTSPAPAPLGPVVIPGGPAMRTRDLSWIYIDAVEPREIKLHDIVTITVDEKSEVIMNSRFNRQKNARLKAEIKEFLRIGNEGNLERAALNGPKIDTQLQGNLNTTGQVTDQEGIKYRIAATVADVLPNGIVRLEARKVIQTQDDVSEYTLTGELRAVDIGPDNMASSENVANLRIEKRQRGKVYDSVKRNWGYRLYDLIFPF